MSGTEEVPNTRPTQKPIYWKEMSIAAKAWYMIRDYIPTALWIAFGIFCIYLGGPNDGAERHGRNPQGRIPGSSLVERLESDTARDPAAESYRALEEGR